MSRRAISIFAGGPASLTSSRRKSLTAVNCHALSRGYSSAWSPDPRRPRCSPPYSRRFKDRWSSKFTLPITAELIQLIEESWASDIQPTPYEVYLKVCYSISTDAREGMGYVLPPSMQTLLLDYQETAVRTLARRIVRRG